MPDFISVKRGYMTKHRISTPPANYLDTLHRLKAEIQASRVRASLAVNRELVGLYWHIGHIIVERQRMEGWGKSLVERLAADLNDAFPDMKGFSPNNIWRMRSFYLAWNIETEILAQAVQELASLPTLPPPVSPLPPEAADLLRPPADREFLARLVRELPWGHNLVLVQRIKTPAFVGQLNFYLSAIDDRLRREGDNPTIGLILCKSKDKLAAEYALRGLSQPLAVADYLLTKAIPQELQGALPTIEEIEAELALIDGLESPEGSGG
jgi:predicted nuclease of restriction endonuclease-like (RecB) superfamily